MPALNDISVELHCQQGPTHGGPIEEFAPHLSEPVDLPDQFMPSTYDHATRTVSVYIPIFPMQQFWVVYSAKPPKPDDAIRSPAAIGVARHNICDGDPTSPLKNIFYVFKLFSGKDEIATWSCGPKQEWRGKTVFGIFDTGTPQSGKGLQKRIMTFGTKCLQVSQDSIVQNDKERKIEVRVYRADGALRVPRQTDIWHGDDVSEVKMEVGGLTVKGHPKRYFMFSLVDPLDQPFTTFRFYYRNWEEIDALNLRMSLGDEENPPELFTTKGDRIIKDNKRKVIQVLPLLSFSAEYPVHPVPVHNGSLELQAVMLLPPNHPDAPERVGSSMRYPYHIDRRPSKSSGQGFCGEERN